MPVSTQIPEKLLSILLSNLNVLSTVINELEPGWFEEKQQKYLCYRLLGHFREYGSLLTFEALELYLKRDRAKPESVQEYKNCFFYLKGLQVDPGEFSFLKDQLVHRYRGRELAKTIKHFLDLCENEDYQQGFKVLTEKVFSLNDVYRKLIIDRGEVFEDYPNRLQLLEDKKAHPDQFQGYLTGIGQVDDLTGGLWLGELGLVFGKTTVGKSSLVLQFAKTNYLNGKRVLYITEEMPRLQVAMRFDSSFSNVEYRKLKMPWHLSEEEQGRWQWKMQGLEELHQKGARFFIHHVPTGCNPSVIMGELEYLKVKEGRLPELVIVDDLDMMSVPKNLSREEGQTANARGLKEIAGAYKVALWVTTQAKTTSYKKENLSLDDTAYSVGKVHVSDLVLGLQQTDEEKALGRITLQLVKFRDGPVNRKIYLSPDLSRFVIHSETLDSFLARTETTV